MYIYYLLYVNRNYYYCCNNMLLHQNLWLPDTLIGWNCVRYSEGSVCGKRVVSSENKVCSLEVFIGVAVFTLLISCLRDTTCKWYYRYIKHFRNNRFVSEIIRKVMAQNNIVLCTHDSTITIFFFLTTL